MNVYLVGGAVRDELLGRPVHERDWVVVGATPEQLVAEGFRPVGRDFPVFLHPETGDEYALARTERKTARGYRGFEVHASPEVTLEQDLMRRDLTVNAIAKDEDGALVDPYCGIRDLRDRVLRHVSPAFVEDPLRVLRVARFAASLAPLRFSIAPETGALMARIVDSGELDALVPERVWQETRRALETDRPDVYFATLRACGALAVVFPELDRLFGTARDDSPGSDAGEHMLAAAREAAGRASDARVRFAALVAGLGAPGPGSAGPDDVGAGIVAELAARLRAPKDFRDPGVLAARFHRCCHAAAELGAGALLDMLEGLDAFRRPERLDGFLVACEADWRAGSGREDGEYRQSGVLRRALAAASAVRPQAEGGVPGEEIGRRLREERLRAIEALHGTRDQ